MLLALLMSLFSTAAGTQELLRPPPPEPERQRFAPVFQRGVAYTHLQDRGTNRRSPRRSRESLRYVKKRLGAEWVSFQPLAFQLGRRSPSIQLGRDDPPDDELRASIDLAHRLGLKVMLKPHIWLDEHRDERWRGTIEMADEDGWQAWFESYRRFILHYARLAAATEVELFCVGTELATTARQREADWRLTIARIRQAYGGPLVYAANWWGEYDQIAFWDALDYIGINAFFPLSDGANPSMETLRHRARQVAEDIALLHMRTGKPVIFTEVGFRSVSGATIRPWAWPPDRELGVDVREQARAYEAVFSTFWSQPWFYGMYWWQWFSDLGRGGLRNAEFTPHRKPAEQILVDWFARPIPVGISGSR